MLNFFRIQEVKEDIASLLEDKAKTLKAAYYHKTYGFYLLLTSLIFLASKACKTTSLDATKHLQQHLLHTSVCEPYYPYLQDEHDYSRG